MNIYIVVIIYFLLFSHTIFGQTVIINELMSSNVNTIEDADGESNDWIEIYNNQTTTINLEGYSLTDNPDQPLKWTFPNVEIPANGYIVIWASGKDIVTPSGEIHTNFKISSDGEVLQLLSSTQELLDESPAVQLDADISLGRTPNDLVNWFYFEETTPFVTNQTIPYVDQAKSPVFSNTSGFYTQPILVTLNPNHPDDIIRYTLDGTIPTPNSPNYNTSILIEDTKVLRVRTFRPNTLPSRIITNSYLFENDLNLQVVSLATDYNDFDDFNSEKPVHVEYFEKNNSLGFKIDMGMKIHGADANSQKSLRLYARPEYGKKNIEYPIFDGLNIDTFKRLILRNAGNDNSQKHRIHIKDGFLHQLYKSQNHNNAISAYQPVHVFLNGNYFGIYNLRERQDEHYIKSHFGYDKDEVDFLEYDYAEPNHKKTVCGDWDDWETLKTFLIQEDISTEANYQIVNNWIDIDNFIDYQIFEILIGNQDWLNNNIKFWRPQNSDGKWKWVLWDTEYGLGTQVNYPVGQPDFDFMHMAMSWGGWGNGDWTWMLRNLMDNEEFKNQFILRFTDLLNTTFLPDYLSEELDKTAAEILPDFDKQLSKWGSSMNNWNEHYDHTIFFMENRSQHCRTHLANEFNLNQNLWNVDLDISETDAGNIQINSIFIDENTLGWQEQPYPWNGLYFEDYPIQITVTPKDGYEFSHWEGDLASSESSLNITLSSDLSLTAVFTPINFPLGLPALVINEVMAKNQEVYPDESGEHEDWIEIYNLGEEPVNLAGFYFSDDFTNPTKWQIPLTSPSLTTVAPQGFMTFFADENPAQGELHLDFKLNRDGEQVGLYFEDDNNIIHLIDALSFPGLENNQSYGRLPNGGTEWVTFDISTPNASNEIISEIVTQNNPTLGLTVYPNPTSEILFVQSAGETDSTHELRFYDVYGNLLLTRESNTNQSETFDLSDWEAGFYFVTINRKGNPKKWIRKFVIAK